jgi:hypothetical protein
MAYTDLLNVAMTNLQTQLASATGLTVVTDPRQINPPCILINAPSWEAMNWNIASVTFPVDVIGSGVGDIYSLQDILAKCAAVISAKCGVKEGRPTTIDIGGTQMPAYELSITVEASTN